MPRANRGEVWLVDLGMAAKARPALILNISFKDDERALYAIVPHTTALRGGRFEVQIHVPWLQVGAFDVQGIRNIPPSVLLRRLGALSPAELEGIIRATKIWFGIS